jgi:cephalosporin hydroxylase
VGVLASVKGRYKAVRNLLHDSLRGYRYGRDLSGGLLPAGPGPQTSTNALEEYFDAHDTGPGIWKWRHYFPVYDRHLSKFRGREVHIVEIGIYSGGSLGMWRDYFGEGAHVYGVDIAPECKAYEGPGVKVFIGDQSDPAFWKKFLDEVPEIDIVIDDGGHRSFQQIPTLEALLPRIRPGGVYLCEDLHGRFNPFVDYVSSMARNLHSKEKKEVTVDHQPTEFQRAVDSVHFYPYVAVIEKREESLPSLVAPKHGTEWQPFLNVPSMDAGVG